MADDKFVAIMMTFYDAVKTLYTRLPNDETDIRRMRIILRSQIGFEQNPLDHQLEFPRAAKATLESFYVHDGLVGADSIEDAIQLREELQHLFSLGGFELRKWKTSDKTVEQSIAKQFRDEQSSCTIKYAEHFTKVLGVEWNAITDTFRPKVSTAMPTRQTHKTTT